MRQSNISLLANRLWPPARRAEDGGALAPVRSPEGGRPQSVWVTNVTHHGSATVACRDLERLKTKAKK